MIPPMSQTITRGFLAGFVATITLSVFMLMKQAMGVMPELSPIAMITQMSGMQTQAIGWIMHFFIGTIMWGGAFALLAAYLPGPYWLRGIIFATGAWLMMMVIVMPMAGAGLFGLELGMMAPVATLMLHWVFGVVLGGVYGAQTQTTKAKVA